MTMISGNNRPDPERDRQDANEEGVAAEEYGSQPFQPVTAGAAVEFLSDLPSDAVLLICAHGFEGMEEQAWLVTHFADATTEEGRTFVLIEGAGDPDKTKPEPEFQQVAVRESDKEDRVTEAEGILGRGEV